MREIEQVYRHATYTAWHDVHLGRAMMKVEDEDSEHDRQRAHEHDAREVHTCTVTRHHGDVIAPA